MGIDRRMSSYKTYYSGTDDRITNLQLGVGELDGTLVPPGGTFSLNQAIGERTIKRGFRSAPVIIGNEYAEEVGGGTSQIATTAFNAAWEAGLRITERHRALALRRSIPARARRDRVLAVTRPEVRQRHEEVGARKGVQRRGDGYQRRDLRQRDAARRVERRAARDRPAPSRSGGSRIARSSGGRAWSRRRAHLRAARRRRERSTRRTARSSARRPGTPPTSRRTASFASERRRRRLRSRRSRRPRRRSRPRPSVPEVVPPEPGATPPAKQP